VVAGTPGCVAKVKDLPERFGAFEQSVGGFANNPVLPPQCRAPTGAQLFSEPIAIPRNFTVRNADESNIEAIAISFLLGIQTALFFRTVNGAVDFYCKPDFRKEEIDNPPPADDMLRAETTLKHSGVERVEKSSELSLRRGYGSDAFCLRNVEYATADKLSD
jgi:hypothetical protein